MKIISEDLKNKYNIQKEEDLKPKLEQKIVFQEEAPKLIECYIQKLDEIKINNIKLISKVFNNDTILIDPSLNINIINKALGLNEDNLFNFLYNIYFYNQNKFLEKIYGNYLFIQIPTISFLQIGENRFQLDY
jgi:hypothetical protein